MDRSGLRPRDDKRELRESEESLLRINGSPLAFSPRDNKCEGSDDKMVRRGTVRAYISLCTFKTSFISFFEGRGGSQDFHIGDENYLDYDFVGMQSANYFHIPSSMNHYE